MARPRADAALTEAGYFSSREKAKAAILAGDVRVDGVPLSKPGVPLPEGRIEVAEAPRYVSRGGVKLAGALEAFGVDVSGVRAVDVGASTGGFTDVLLQHGATSVTAIDVGYGQLAWSLRNDPRVHVFERTNIREADPAVVGSGFDLAVVDVSFIGFVKVLPHIARLLAEHGSVIALVKPQFEAGKGRVGKKGVVRDASVHTDVLRSVIDAAHEQGWRALGLSFSPITGPEGNIEFWIRLAREGEETNVSPEDVVCAAHKTLEG
jgi:23S rRNA (cytidine1920-2'-O)/16S rRNA (cytidine1409-2'-O)-methyltransferase